jgi:hypothetical protein
LRDDLSFASFRRSGFTEAADADLTNAQLRAASPGITRWEHEDVLEAAQKRLDKNPQAMRQRRETVECPFATLKMRMGATHLVMKRLPKVAIETALHVLACNLTPVMNIMGIQPLMAAIRAQSKSKMLTGATTSLASDPFRQSVLTRPRPQADMNSQAVTLFRDAKRPRLGDR